MRKSCGNKAMPIEPSHKERENNWAFISSSLLPPTQPPGRGGGGGDKTKIRLPRIGIEGTTKKKSSAEFLNVEPTRPLTQKRCFSPKKENNHKRKPMGAVESV